MEAPKRVLRRIVHILSLGCAGQMERRDRLAESFPAPVPLRVETGRAEDSEPSGADYAKGKGVSTSVPAPVPGRVNIIVHRHHP